MKKLIAAFAAVGVAVPLGVGATLTIGAPTDSQCWDEYNVRGTRFYGTLTPKDLPLDDCTPGTGCKIGYDDAGNERRLYVPLGANPAQACSPPTTTTTTTTTAAAPTTIAAPPANGGSTRFGTIQPGGALPTDLQCSVRVRPMTENRPGNATANQTRGNSSNDTYPRVTGNFVGSTDEIIQWVACKWGIDEDIVRAQVIAESYWNQSTKGDFTKTTSACAPGFPIGNYPAQYSGDSSHNGQCPESIGLGQVRWLYHQTAFENNNATASSAYNLDYTYAVWRTCYEGGFTWLNTVDRGRQYSAGDAQGCLGLWFSGRWYTQPAIDYISKVAGIQQQRQWEQAAFPPAQPRAASGAIATPTTAAPPTTKAPTTTAAPPTTKAPTTTAAPPTTKAPTTTATPTTAKAPTTTAATARPAQPSASSFVATFDGNTGLERFDTGVYHRDEHIMRTRSWTGDHDLNCGTPDTQRSITRDRPQDSFYMCRDHLMTSVGDTSGYSIAWFSPKQTFQRGTHTTISWDVNVTDLGNRQWWEVVLIGEGQPFLTTIDWVAKPANIEAYHPETIAVGKGPFGNDGNIFSGGVARDPLQWQHVCGSFAVDPEGCNSKAIRRSFSITDNGNGTITYNFLGQEYTYPGQFPKSFRVYFKDHNYTPDKDGVPAGHTWHWDNVVVS